LTHDTHGKTDEVFMRAAGDYFGTPLNRGPASEFTAWMLHGQPLSKQALAAIEAWTVMRGEELVQRGATPERCRAVAEELAAVRRYLAAP
jgi:hypothetical protein